MKTKTTLLLAALVVAFTAPLALTHADEKKPAADAKASSKVEAGPRKGRILADPTEPLAAEDWPESER